MTNSALLIVFLAGFGLIAVLTLIGAMIVRNNRSLYNENAPDDRPLMPFPDDEDGRGFF
jgi:hypothetical protein